MVEVGGQVPSAGWWCVRFGVGWEAFLSRFFILGNLGLWYRSFMENKRKGVRGVRWDGASPRQGQ